MVHFEPARPAWTLLAGGSATALAALLGAPLEPALLTGAIGALAVWLARPGHRPPATPPAPRAAPAGPGFAEIAGAIDDPILLIVQQRVTFANATAKAVLGAHIVGEDIRLAIRHPAATERLVTHPPAPDAPPEEIELVGLGERERRWAMTVHALGAAGLLVRLVDRSGSYATERMRVDFVANASHELRTPLATLLGFIETLQGEAASDPATRARFLTIMLGEAKRMQSLLDDLMSLSRIEADKYSPPEASVALGPLIEEARDALHESARITLVEAPDTPPVTGDRAQLSQALHNILGNALKYGRPGTPIRVTLAAEDAMVRVTVADEGEGIAAEHLPRLTERFYRADNGRSRALGGTGLGLAIVKHIVERHRGRLTIESIVGRGTTVTLRLPVAPALSSKSHTEAT
ncbi:MAG TPA: ATP-binding protein [Sphingomonadaceae bacterium]|nr:ATP-binding protein [Sphingomonadaceae bacterium]